GGLVEQVFAANTEATRRYVATAEQFLGVAADLYHGWNPLPRLALEMSTVAEMLLVGGGSEEVSRRLRIAAAWLGGIGDADRDVIHDFAKKLYDAGSAYRHGCDHLPAGHAVQRGPLRGFVVSGEVAIVPVVTTAVGERVEGGPESQLPVIASRRRSTTVSAVRGAWCILHTCIIG